MKRDRKIEFYVSEDVERVINFHVANSPSNERATWVREAVREKLARDHDCIMSFKSLVSTCLEHAKSMCNRKVIG